MDLARLADLASIVEALLVAVSAVFIWREVRETRRLARAENSQRFVELSSPVYLQLVQDERLAALWLTGADAFPTLSAVDQYRYTELVRWWLGFYENVYLQRQWMLLSDDVEQGWGRELDSLIRTPSFATLWPQVRGLYSDVFGRFVDRKLADAPRLPPGAAATTTGPLCVSDE